MTKKITLCRHSVNTLHCVVCAAERKRAAEAQAEKERKRKEYEAQHPNKHKAARKVLGLES